jgi:hypothetical protein
MAREIPTQPMLDNCAKCGRETRHEPDNVGTYHCTECRSAAVRMTRKRWGRILVAVFIGALLIGGLIYYLARRSVERAEQADTEKWGSCVRGGEWELRKTAGLGVDVSKEARARCDEDRNAFPEPPSIEERTRHIPPVLEARSTDKADAELERVALKALYERCSANNELWKLGTKLQGNIVREEERTMVRIGGWFIYPGYSDNERLQYTVTLGDKDQLRSYRADTTISAGACWLAGSAEQEFVKRPPFDPAKPRQPDKVQAAEPNFRAAATEPKDRALEEAAMKALYAHCSKFNGAWLEGTTLSATTAPQDERRVEIRASIARSDDFANGERLRYSVTFIGERPAWYRAMTDVSAALCDLHTTGSDNGLPE